MKVLGIYGSPRKKGNTDLILDRVLEGARSEGAETEAVYCRKLDMRGCIECGGCDETGECVIDDDMRTVYPLMQDADIIFMASPIFFYDVTSQAKAVIDRSQAMWNRRMLRKTPEQRKTYDSGAGYLIAIGATKGKRLFEAPELVAKYFFDALDMNYKGGLLVRSGEHKGSVTEEPGLMDKAFEFGQKAVADNRAAKETKAE